MDLPRPRSQDKACVAHDMDDDKWMENSSYRRVQYLEHEDKTECLITENVLKLLILMKARR